MKPTESVSLATPNSCARYSLSSIFLARVMRLAMRPLNSIGVGLLSFGTRVVVGIALFEFVPRGWAYPVADSVLERLRSLRGWGSHNGCHFLVSQ